MDDKLKKLLDEAQRIVEEKGLPFMTVKCPETGMHYVVYSKETAMRKGLIDPEEKQTESMTKRKIYVASSWRNTFYEEVVSKLREAGHEVYDFRNPPSGDAGFKWSCVSPDYMEWTPSQYRDMLQHPKAVRQFQNDIEAMESCDTCVIVLPCGRSAHTEAGWFAGKGKKTVAYIPEKQEPELMYKLFDAVCCSMEELIRLMDDNG